MYLQFEGGVAVVHGGAFSSDPSAQSSFPSHFFSLSMHAPYAHSNVSGGHLIKILIILLNIMENNCKQSYAYNTFLEHKPCNHEKLIN